MFDRWHDTLSTAHDATFRDLDFALEVGQEDSFGVWLLSGSQDIRINRGTVRVIRALAGNALADGGFDLGVNLQVDPTSLLSELAFQWLMAHETAHWLLGHPEFLYRNCPDPLQGIAFSELMLGAAGEAPDGLDRVENICAELQADSLAFELLAHLHLDREASTEEPIPPLLLEVADPFARLRIPIIAAGLVVLLIDTLRGSNFYPTPAARIFNLLIMALATGNQDAVRIGPSGPAIVGSDDGTIMNLGRSLREAIMPAGFCLEAVSRTLGIRTTLIHYEGGKSPTLDDLLLSTRVRREGQYQTEGARQFDEWDRLLHEKVRTAWLPFARIDVWTAPS